MSTSPDSRPQVGPPGTATQDELDRFKPAADPPWSQVFVWWVLPGLILGIVCLLLLTT